MVDLIDIVEGLCVEHKLGLISTGGSGYIVCRRDDCEICKKSPLRVGVIIGPKHVWIQAPEGHFKWRLIDFAEPDSVEDAHEVLNNLHVSP
jgi:hypothetical protein